MASFSAWIQAFRLRTLPLSLSGVVMGSLLAVEAGSFRWDIFFLAILTTLLLQILSNLANDYGDSQNGADNTGRIGPQRSVQSGAISPLKMRGMIMMFVTLSFISGVSLISIAGIDYQSDVFYTLLGIGILAILAALFYTMGKVPYGYMALGDISVLLFFGFFSVLATFFLFDGWASWAHFLPASSVGLFSVGVLNLNNMRDAENDLRSGKITLANRLGMKNARTYHLFLVLLPFLSAAIYILITHTSNWAFLCFLLLLPIVMHLRRLYKYVEPALIDRELKILAVIALAFTILFGIGVNL
jgi:1,4-dihydroxy-2-naphthoate polyprenyltransferase